jgi:hypothetical protein
MIFRWVLLTAVASVLLPAAQGAASTGERSVRVVSDGSVRTLPLAQVCFRGSSDCGLALPNGDEPVVRVRRGSVITVRLGFAARRAELSFAELRGDNGDVYPVQRGAGEPGGRCWRFRVSRRLPRSVNTMHIHALTKRRSFEYFGRVRVSHDS